MGRRDCEDGWRSRVHKVLLFANLPVLVDQRKERSSGVKSLAVVDLPEEDDEDQAGEDEDEGDGQALKKLVSGLKGAKIVEKRFQKRFCTRVF